MSSTLAPPTIATNGRPGTLEQLPELLELALEQEAGVGREQVRDPLGRGVRTMRRAERVVHVQVGLGGELLRQCGVVRRLARVEPRVLEHTHALVGSEQLEQPLGDRRDRIRGVGPLRAAEVRADDDLCRVALEQQAQGRQRRSDAGVVGHAAVLERDVQVRAHEDSLAGDVGVANRPRAVHGYAVAAAASTGSVSPIMAIRSTSRQL